MSDSGGRLLETQDRHLELRERYLERAADWLGGRRINRVLADRVALPSQGGAALAAWWLPPDAPAPLLVAPNPWDDRDAVAAAEAHVHAVVDATVARLAALLEPQREPEQWHLLLAPWLVHAASAVLDRLLFVLTAARLAPDAPVMAAGALEAPATMGEAVASYRTDEGNRRLVGAIASAVGVRVDTAAPGARPAPPPPSPRRGSAVDRRQLARLGAAAFEASVLSLARPAPTTLVGMGPLRPGDALRLAAAARGIWLAPPWRRAGELRPPPADPQARAILALAGADPRTPAGALWALLPRMLPRSVLEGRAQVEAESRRRFGHPRHVVVNNYAADEVQNTFVAACHAAGRRLTFAQHGGFYLQARVNGHEWLERRPGATFLSWGGSGDGVAVAPAPRLAPLLDGHRGGDSIVLVEGIQPPDTFPIRFGSHPLANQAYAHDRQLVELLARVSPATRARIVLKRFPSHLPDVARAPALAALPHRGPVRSRRAVDWMARARLAVLTYPDTPFIEALLLGVPTIGLWPAALWELRDDARAPFDLLAEAGVVFDDAAAAAAQLDAVAAEPGPWWRSAPVQAARSAFLARFAAVGRRPLQPWVAHLRSLRRQR